MMFNMVVYWMTIGALCIMTLLGIGLLVALFLYPIIFWTRMLIDCINRNFNTESDKLLWILIILLGNLLGAIVYYYCVKNKK